jgi:hypothetical protein
LLIPFILVRITAAASPDPRLLSLVPPGAQLVAGIGASSIQGQPNNFVLMTHNNSIDLGDFFALTGADDTLTIHQIVLVAANNEGQPEEHSLLASGHFDQPHVFKSAVDTGAAVTNYRGIPVLEIQLFARERGKLKGVRWLAVLDSSMLVFGSVASTRLEIDRYLAHTPADDSLLGRLARLRSKDQTWCLLSASSPTLPSLSRGDEIHAVLAQLSPDLAQFAQSGNELEFGLYYSSRVEFDFEVTLAPTEASRNRSESSAQAPVGSPISFSLLPKLNATRDANTLRGVIQLWMPHYKAWLAGIRNQR